MVISSVVLSAEPTMQDGKPYDKWDEYPYMINSAIPNVMDDVP